jgi:hypothetical protein
LTRGSSSEVVLGGGFLGGGGGGGGGGSLSEYLYERWGGLNDEKMKCQSVTYLVAKFEIPYTLRSKRFLL